MLQSYHHIEIIIVNDGSTDNTGKILTQLSNKDTRIIIIENKNNIGFIKSLNKGLTYCKGKYIARTDADDVTEPFWIQTIIEKMEKEPDLLAVGGFITVWHSDNQLGHLGNYTHNGQIFKSCLNHNEIIRGLPFNNVMHHNTMIIKSDVFNKYHLHYDELYPHAEDYKQC